MKRSKSCNTICFIKILHAVLHATHTGDSDPNHYPLLELCPTDRHFIS